MPLEAFIGIVFATAQALVFLVLEKSPSGPEHLKETLVGSLFTVDPRTSAGSRCCTRSSARCTSRCANRSSRSRRTPRARRSAAAACSWDFLFYATFGLVVTSSGADRGVLLVFGFLVIPGGRRLMASARTGVALAVGWAFGFTCSVAGLLASVQWDLPAAPSILVTALGAARRARRLAAARAGSEDRQGLRITRPSSSSVKSSSNSGRCS